MEESSHAVGARKRRRPASGDGRVLRFVREVWVAVASAPLALFLYDHVINGSPQTEGDIVLLLLALYLCAPVSFLVLAVAAVITKVEFMRLFVRYHPLLHDFIWLLLLFLAAYVQWFVIVVRLCSWFKGWWQENRAKNLIKGLVFREGKRNRA
jgi:hypothetical protein